MIDLERVATFLAVAKHGGFREAAKHTGLSQPAVTQHVKHLEFSLRSMGGCLLNACSAMGLCAGMGVRDRLDRRLPPS